VRETIDPSSPARGVRLYPVVREGGLPLVVIVIVALVARSINLNSGLWIDEIYALLRSFRLPVADVLTTYLGDNHHPLYSIFGRLSLVVFGEEPWSLRLPAVLSGAATVPATYAVARLVASRTEALLASLILAVSYHHVWFSQNARGYTLTGLLALLSTWALVRMLERGSSRLAWAYALCAALAAYTHLTMVFVAVGQAIVAASVIALPARGTRRVDWRVPASAFVLAAVLTVLFYAPMLNQVLDFFLNRPSRLLGTSTPSWAFREAIRVLLVGLGGAGAVLAAVVLAAGAAAGALGLASIFRTNRTLALAIVVPSLVVFVGALVGRGTMYPRFFFFAAGTAVIVLVRGLFASVELLRRRWTHLPAPAIATACCAIVVAASVASLRYNYRYPKQDFAGAMRYVLATKAPDDVVGFAGVPNDPYPAIYGQNWPTIESVDEINALRKRGRTWLIYTFPRYLGVGAPGLSAIVERDCHERAVFRGTVGGGDMIICTFERT
jgi:mannosyltransferase